MASSDIARLNKNKITVSFNFKIYNWDLPLVGRRLLFKSRQKASALRERDFLTHLQKMKEE